MFRSYHYRDYLQQPLHKTMRHDQYKYKAVVGKEPVNMSGTGRKQKI